MSHNQTKMIEELDTLRPVAFENHLKFVVSLWKDGFITIDDSLAKEINDCLDGIEFHRSFGEKPIGSQTVLGHRLTVLDKAIEDSLVVVKTVNS